MRSRDAFAGGFVAGIVEGKSLEESVDMGHWLASLSIRELGPSYVLALFGLQQSKTPLPNTVSSFSQSLPISRPLSASQKIQIHPLSFPHSP